MNLETMSFKELNDLKTKVEEQLKVTQLLKLEDLREYCLEKAEEKFSLSHRNNCPVSKMFNTFWITYRKFDNGIEVPNEYEVMCRDHRIGQKYNNGKHIAIAIQMLINGKTPNDAVDYLKERTV